MVDAVQDRISLVYTDKRDGSERELPCKILVLSDLDPMNSVDLFEDIEPIQIRSNSMSGVFSAVSPKLKIRVENFLNSKIAHLDVNISFRAMEDFHPELLCQSIPGFRELVNLRDSLCSLVEKPSIIDEATAEQMMAKLNLTLSDTDKLGPVIARIDEKLNLQLNAVLHHQTFVQLEQSWRALEYLVKEIEFRENCKLDVLPVSKEDLQDSFEDSPEVFQSPLYQLVYSNEFGQFGGEPYSLIIGDYTFDASVPEIALLTSLSKVAAISHAPFISAAAPKMFSLSSFEEFSRIRDLTSHFAQPTFDKWLSFRSTPDSRYVSLCLPRFVLRQPYVGNLNLGFDFEEKFKKGEDKGVWGNGAMALGAKISQAFSKYRWYVNIVGEENGVLETLGLETGRGAQRAKIPTEVMISDRVEGDLVKEGFIPITLRKGMEKAGFYSAVCVRKPGEDLTEIQAQLDSQLAFILISCRFAHYLKVIQRENIGAWVSRAQIDLELNKWIKQYISDMDNPAPGVRARRPLRAAKVAVREIEGKAGWFSISITITPHFKYLGQAVNLQEVGRLDRN